MIDFLPRLMQLRAAKAQSKPRRIVIFVHGIYSSHATFDDLVTSFEGDPRFDGYDLAAYDYDWGEPILRSAERLRDILNGRAPADAEVTLVAHSMGGLVSRFALIGGDLPCVRRIFMLGTPNFGAFTARQLSVLWQTAVAVAARITPLFPRKAGLRDLTRPQTLYSKIAGDAPSVPVARAAAVEYVTIPGLFYHDERRVTDPGEQNRALPFTAGGLLFEAMNEFPFSRIEIERPHDGVVEASSVTLRTDDPGRLSEKHAAIRQPAQRGRTYCHAVPDSMRQCAHMGIQGDVKVAKTIKGIMLAGGAPAWESALTIAERDSYPTLDVP
jgi:pimeloyl-ACP methyl ester carboxylesterase